VCEQESTAGLSRRSFLAGSAAVAAVAAGGGRLAAAPGPLPGPVPVGFGLEVLPRDAWGADLPPGPLQPETPRFLLVHHTASPSNYRDAREVLRGGYAFQTGPAKGWPDVCYQFFVGRDGDVWEGRAGSLAGPVMADATGGSQGWAQLVCLIGDFTSSLPTDAALESLVKVLAFIAHRDGIAVGPDATTSFVSRGSQRWRAGVTVTTPTIAAHRDMSYTECPGDPVIALLPELRTEVAARVRAMTSGPATPSAEGLLPARRLGRVSAP
jgi:hypothetical protein